jgi:TonB family protein
VKRNSKPLRQILFAFTLCLLLNAASLGQAVGNLSKDVMLNGKVVDLGGHPVPKANVTVELDGQSCKFQADSLGLFKIQLRSGEYKFSFQADGFSRAIYTNLVLQAGRDLNQTFELHPGSCNDCTGLVAESSPPEIYDYDDPRIKPPVIVSRPEPAYTALAKEHNIEGKVVLRVVLDATGAVTKIFPVEKLPYGLTESAIEAARKVTFQTASSNDGSVSSYFTLSYEFSLHNSECHLIVSQTRQ